MIIDCHGHYTTAPPQLADYRARLLAAGSTAALPPVQSLEISDEEIRASVEGAQLRLQHERGTDVTVFSPQAAGMRHHEGGPEVSALWARACNDLVARVCALFPGRFVGVAQLPQSPGVAPGTCVEELRRCVEDLGFIGANLNPDPSGGWWTDPPVTDPWWSGLHAALVELDVPAMIHVSASCNPNFHTTGAHYIAADTAVFMQLLTGDLFERFPTLRLVLPHGGGAVPFHWGRYRGMAQDLGLGPLEDRVRHNVFFDTCVYHQPGMRLLTEVVPTANVLFASETVGAVRGIDPRTGHHYDDTRRYVDALDSLDDDARADIYERNVRRVYPRIAAALPATTAS